MSLQTPDTFIPASDLVLPPPHASMTPAVAFVLGMLDALEHGLGQRPQGVVFGGPQSRVVREEVRLVLRCHGEMTGEVVVGLSTQAALKLAALVMDMPASPGMDEISRDALAEVFRHMANAARLRLQKISLHLAFDLPLGVEVNPSTRVMGKNTGLVSLRAPGVGAIRLYHQVRHATGRVAASPRATGTGDWH